jgi:hypothetical protein
MPELKEGWAMEKNRFPLAPYWCLTMKHARVSTAVCTDGDSRSGNPPLPLVREKAKIV